jgi:hypothetical protein
MEMPSFPLAAGFTCRCLRAGLLVFFSALAVLPFAGQAQVVTKTNSLASYSYGATNAFVPSEPLVSASGSLSTFSFLPISLAATSSGPGPATNIVTAFATLDMAANPGLWFEGVGHVNAQVNYSLSAPTSTSSARAEFSAPLTLLVTAVNGSPFAPSSLPVATSMMITPPFVAVTGPGSFPSASMSGVFAFDINTVKAHFGIGAGSNITGLRLQVSPVLTVQSERGSAAASVVNFDVATQVVPEPSSCALLLLGAGVSVLAVWRRRHA